MKLADLALVIPAITSILAIVALGLRGLFAAIAVAALYLILCWLLERP